MMIREYFRHVETSLSSSSWVKSVSLLRYDILEIDEEEILVYRFRVSLTDGGVAEISERVISKKMESLKRQHTVFIGRMQKMRL
jgi:hypothetical protein